jgi:hypothetical protein
MNERKPGRRAAMDATTPKPGKPDARLGRDVQTKIGQQLRAIYDEVVSEGVPDRFSDLLRKLDKKSDKESQ